MKALKTVAVALGITLAALIVIPLIVLAGLFVWLKVTEEQEGRGRDGEPEEREPDRRQDGHRGLDDDEVEGPQDHDAEDRELGHAPLASRMTAPTTNIVPSAPSGER